MATVGRGKYTYELVPDWERLPEGWVLGQTAIVTDKQDRVYLFNRGEHPLIVLDRDGNFLTSWGEGQLPDAHGMYIDDDENLYMPVKNSHVVLKYDPKGNLLMTMGEWDKPLRHRLVGAIQRRRRASRRAVQQPQRHRHTPQRRPVHFRRLRQRSRPPFHQ